MEEAYLHVDMDAFFASVEQLDNPLLRGKPVIVGGLPGDRRSVVATASYEARKYGVHSAMPTARAFELCPNGIFLRGRMERYHEKSEEIMKIFELYSPDVIQISVDEAFIDLTGTERLLGSPYDVAVQLKREVKEKTGLTVSVGLAPTMYLAKIASGFKKPDGLTVIHHGEEVSFMTALPLEKVWGVGSKTLEHLHRAGFTSTKSIYTKSEHLLQSIFGNNTGSFLYNAVRGNKGMKFGDEARNHSISSETTFDFDLLDRYAIETALMQLSQTVMFRLHREGFHTQTISLKIRYEDFTTVSVQETSDFAIVSADDLFKRCVNLFSKKYEIGRGIRLLGVSAQNVEGNDKPVQKNLFDMGDEKRAKLEKTILSIEDKHPGVKIQKARILRAKGLLILICCLLPSLLCPQLLSGESEQITASGAGSIVFSESAPLIPSLATDESPVSLFNYTVASKNIEFLAQGYWQSEILHTTNTTFGYGTAFGLSLGTPVFTQKVDLSLWFMLDKKWYFESSFADGFKKNTVAAGYRGDGILKEARVANRGIVFPQTYAAVKTGHSLGGGDNSAPGVSLHFEDTLWKADAVLRYDMLTQKTKSYSGMNSVSTTKIESSAFVTGRQFILPEASFVSDVSGVYIESASGTYRGNDGRTFVKLESSDYLLVPAQNMILLSADAGATKINGVLPVVAVSFASAETPNLLKTSLGSYGTAKAPGASGTFLGDLQRFFGSQAATVPDLEKFSYTLFATIDSTTVLVLQHPSGFSPFAVCARYNAGYFTSSATDAAVVHVNSGTVESSYTVTQSADDALLVSENYFSATQLWLTVIASDADGTSYKIPSRRFPFAAQYPLCYLGNSNAADIAIELKTYTSVSEFNIGTNVSDGTVTVYINNIVDYGATYDRATGIVTCSRLIGSSDAVTITWSEDSNSSTGGAIAVGAGFSYLLTPRLTADISLTSRWSFSPSNSFADATNSAPGFAAFTTGLSYKSDSISFSNALSLSIDDINTTGFYRILGMNDTSGDDIYLSSNAGALLPQSFAPTLNSRDYLSHTPLDASFDGSAQSIAAVQDASISGYKIPVSWDFTSFSEQAQTAWASVAINLGTAAASLSSDDTFSIALQAPQSLPGGYSVYLQLGVSADDSFTAEDTEQIPTWLVSKQSASDTNSSGVRYAFVPTVNASSAGTSTGTKQLGSGWQQVTVILSDNDKIRLRENYNARLIITCPLANRLQSDFPSAGVLYAGPWSYTGSSYAASYNSSLFQMTLSQEADSTLSSSIVSRFNRTTTNTVLRGDFLSSVTTAAEIPHGSDAIISVERFFEKVSLAPYHSCSMYFSFSPGTSVASSSLVTEDYALLFELTTPDGAGGYTSCLRASLSSAELEQYSGSGYHLLTVNLADHTVSVDGTILSEASASLFVNTAVLPTRFSACINTLSQKNECMYSSGSFCFDELYLHETSSSLAAENFSDFSAKIEGPVVSLKDKAGTSVSLLSNLSFTAQSQVAAGQLISDSSSTFSKSAAGSGALQFSSLGIFYALDAGGAYGADASTVELTTAGYTVRTQNPLFGIISASSFFRTSPVSSSSSSGSAISLSFLSLAVPLTASASSESTQSLWSDTQKANGSITFDSKRYDASCTVMFSQKKNVSHSVSYSLPETFLSSQQSTFASGDFSVLLRTLSCNVTNSIAIPFCSLKPALSLTLDGRTYDSLFNDSAEFLCTIPFAAGNNSFAVSWSKKTGGVQNESTNDLCKSAYGADVMLTADGLSKRAWFWNAIPFADLISNSIANDVLSSVSSTESHSLSYTGTYRISWSHPLYNTYADLLVPSGAQLSACRDISAASSTADTYQIKAGASYSALNLFGLLGPYHVFSWYEQEAVTSSLSAVVKIPRDAASSLSYQLNGYFETDFFLPKDGTLKTGIEASFTNMQNWSAKSTAVWKRAVLSSPLLSLALLMKKNLAGNKIKLTRTDSFNFVSSCASGSSSISLRNAVTAAHLIEAQITKYVTVNAGLSGTYENALNSIQSFSCSASLGGKVTF